MEYFKQIKPQDIYVTSLTHLRIRNDEGWERWEEQDRTARSSGCLFMDAIARLLNEGHFSVQTLAAKLGVGIREMNGAFCVLTGMSAHRFVNEYRMIRAQELLRSTDLDTHEIARRLGFSSQASFSKAFFGHCKQRPTEYQEKNRPKDFRTLYRW